MVNDLIFNSNNSNQSVKRQQIQIQAESNNRPCKKSSKTKKSRVKNSFYAEESDQLPEPSNRRKVNPSEQQKTNSKAVTPKKVKSASWKRSEKTPAPFIALANKKHKSLRKKSPNWLRFSNSKTKKSDPNNPCNESESSACRPGTTYSDVLFGAGCPNLVKMKNCITPRFYNNPSTNVAQKKLTKALIKFNGKPDGKKPQECEAVQKKNVFPALQTIENKFFAAFVKNDSHNNSNNIDQTQVVEKKILTNSTTSSPPIKSDEAEIVILPDLEGLTLDENNISYGNYLEQHFECINDEVETIASTSKNDNKYLITSIKNIPNWNFMSIETGIFDGFPKFLCQFDDENYLKAENMALLGLKLALGSCTPKK